jgi:hypothetical protein
MIRHVRATSFVDFFSLSSLLLPSFLFFFSCDRTQQIHEPY